MHFGEAETPNVVKKLLLKILCMRHSTAPILMQNASKILHLNTYRINGNDQSTISVTTVQVILGQFYTGTNYTFYCSHYVLSINNLHLYCICNLKK